jgi:D-alanyl-D-alanine dipeptidase
VPLPAGFADLADIPGIHLAIAYASTANVTGAPVDGYGCPAAWLRRDAASALAKVEAKLESTGFGLVIFDGYRPARASRALVSWAARTGQSHLVSDGYIAAKSLHNQGRAVDLGLYDRATGALVDMGSPYDTLSVASNTENATGEALVRRHVLRDAMAVAGFAPYHREWWHFEFPGASPALDVPYPACPDGGTEDAH